MKKNGTVLLVVAALFTAASSGRPAVVDGEPRARRGGGAHQRHPGVGAGAPRTDDSGCRVQRVSHDWRRRLRLNATPITAPPTSWTPGPTRPSQRLLRAAGAQRPGAGGRRRFTLPAGAPAAAVPASAAAGPPGGTPRGESLHLQRPTTCSVGDLDGDGEYEIVVNMGSAEAATTRRAATTGEPILEAYRLDGTLLWRINLGKNIREGAHYTQFLVYDLDGDGTRRGRVQDGRRHRRRAGQGHRRRRTADHRNADGYDPDGPRVPHRLRRHDRRGAGDHRLSCPARLGGDGSAATGATNYGNRVDRFLACVAYLDGSAPERRHVPRLLHAHRAGRVGLARRQAHAPLDVRQRRRQPATAPYRGQGNHSLASPTWTATARTRSSTAPARSTTTARGSTRPASATATRCTSATSIPTGPGSEVFDIHENDGSRRRRR